MSKFWQEYPTIQKDLECVAEIMRKEVKCQEKSIESSLLELIESGGKLLRPAFLLLSGGFGKYSSKKLYPYAAVVEMLHMATLVHDDILDDSSHRRGKETIQSKYGKNYAVFMGDYLFSKCFLTLSDSASIDNMKLLSNAISKICIGEIEQFSSKFVLHLSVKKYLKRIAAKTALLFYMSFYIGAKESDCPEALCRKLAMTGYYMGMAFQIIDDILDYTGDEATVGKPLGNDLKEGIYTIPLIYAVKTKDNELSEILSKESYNNKDIKSIIKLATELGGIEKAKLLAKKYTKKAFKEISSLPDHPNREILIDVIGRLIVRDY
jgi:heptaprenyl diphosphate synthase